MLEIWEWLILYTIIILYWYPHVRTYIHMNLLYVISYSFPYFLDIVWHNRVETSVRRNITEYWKEYSYHSSVPIYSISFSFLFCSEIIVLPIHFLWEPESWSELSIYVPVRTYVEVKIVEDYHYMDESERSMERMVHIYLRTYIALFNRFIFSHNNVMFKHNLRHLSIFWLTGSLKEY